jgi:nucleotide-binding universal stress UspA family protein
MAPASALVVAGFDGSPSSEAALRVALCEAKLRQARLLVVSAWHAPTRYYGSAAAPSASRALAEDTRKELATKLEAAVAALREEADGTAIETRLVEGAAAPSVLADEAADADLLVVGSRGFGGFRELVLGSVGRQCAEHAPCPVLVVPSQAIPATLLSA